TKPSSTPAWTRPSSNERFFHPASSVDNPSKSTTTLARPTANGSISNTPRTRPQPPTTHACRWAAQSYLPRKRPVASANTPRTNSTADTTTNRQTQKKVTGGPSFAFQFGVAQVSDEHVARLVRDQQRRPGLRRHRLRRHAARPEHRHLTGSDLHRIAEVGLIQVADTDGGRVAEMDRRAV